MKYIEDKSDVAAKDIISKNIEFICGENTSGLDFMIDGQGFEYVPVVGDASHIEALELGDDGLIEFFRNDFKRRNFGLLNVGGSNNALYFLYLNIDDHTESWKLKSNLSLIHRLSSEFINNDGFIYDVDTSGEKRFGVVLVV